MGGAYGFTRHASANLRRKEDSWNSAIGGFSAGSIIGAARTNPPFRTREAQILSSDLGGKFPAVLGFGAFAAVVLATADYSNGFLTGYVKGTADEEHDKRQALRKNVRRPIEETIEQLGEGRGEFEKQFYKDCRH